MKQRLLSAGVACLAWIVAWSSVGLAVERVQELFNGKDLEGWDGNPSVWSVEDGALVGRTTAERPIEANTFLVWKGKAPSDFRITLEYRIEGGNSGIQYRSRIVDAEKWIVGGYQADIDAANMHTGILYEERGRGIVTKRGQRVEIDERGKATAEDVADSAELKKAIHADDWNTYTIEVNGSRLKHTINDVLLSETDDRDVEKRSVEGVIALQVHTGAPMTVRYRNIHLEAIDANTAPADGAGASNP
jgi:hypothetical protein